MLKLLPEELAAIKPAVGMYVKPDGWMIGSCLIEGDSFSTFRLPTNSGGPIRSLATEVAVSGRSFKRMEWDSKWIRVKVTFKGDGEPDTVTYGWMKYSTN